MRGVGGTALRRLETMDRAKPMEMPEPAVANASSVANDRFHADHAIAKQNNVTMVHVNVTSAKSRYFLKKKR